MAKFEWCVMGHLKFSCDAKIGSWKYNNLISDFQLDNWFSTFISHWKIFSLKKKWISKDSIKCNHGDSTMSFIK